MALPEQQESEAARIARLGAMEVEAFQALGGETLWLGIGSENGAPLVKAGDSAAAISGMCTVQADALAPGEAALVCTGDGAIGLPTPLSLGEQFSSSLWFEVAADSKSKSEGEGAADEAGADFSVFYSGTQPTAQGPRASGVALSNAKDGKQLGVMVMGQFDGCDLSLDMLGPGWHNLVVIYNPNNSSGPASFVVDGVPCGSSRAPLAASIDAVGNFPPAAGQKLGLGVAALHCHASAHFALALALALAIGGNLILRQCSVEASV